VESANSRARRCEKDHVVLQVNPRFTRTVPLAKYFLFLRTPRL
jgi:hypothetical protein